MEGAGSGWSGTVEQICATESKLSFGSLSYCARSSSHNPPRVTDVDSGQYHCRQGDKVRQCTNYTAGAGYKPQVV
jgi:hypothetical protein